MSAPATCPLCDYPVAAPDDVWCERCGAPLGTGPRGDARRAVEAGGVAGVTDVGLVRTQNEDALAVDATELGLIAIVCDGVSSSTDGRAAATAATAAVAASLGAAMRAGGAWDPEAAMDAAVARASEAVGNLATDRLDPARSPSCTLVAAVWDGDAVTVASVGDSRAYWLAPGSSGQLTVDDSWAQEQVAGGTMTERTAMRQPQAHAITNWLGADAPRATPSVTRFVPPGPGHLVLCSDGLWNHVPEPRVLEELVAAGDAEPAALAARLADAALAFGGRDNVTVVVMEVRP